MSLTEGSSANNMVMPVAPMNGGYGSMGNNGDWSFWIVILFLFAFMSNGWGNNGGVNPYVMSNSANDVQRGFDQQALVNGQTNILQALNSNQNVTNASMNSLAMSLQNCCCENRAATADLKYTVANDGAQTRAAIQSGVQSVLDKLCQQEIDALKEQNSNLRTQLNLANLAASQTQQTAQILSDNAAQTQALEHYLNPVPIPAYMVQNPNCCSNLNWSTCNNGFVA